MSDMSRKEVIELCAQSGHSISKAIEIAIDYERGDIFTRKWVSVMQSVFWPFPQTEATQ